MWNCFPLNCGACFFFFFVAQIVDVFYFRPIFPSFIPLNKKWQTPRIVCHDHVEESCFDCKLPPRGLQLHRFFSIFRSVLPERMRRHCESLRGSNIGSQEVKKQRHDIFRYDGITWWHETTFQTTWVFLENFNTWLLRLIISDSTPSAPRHRSKCQGLHWSRREKQVETSVITFDGIYSLNRKLTKIIFFFMIFMGIFPQKVQKLPKLFVSLLQNFGGWWVCFNNERGRLKLWRETWKLRQWRS